MKNVSDKYFEIILSETLKKQFNVDDIKIELEPHMVNPTTYEIDEDSTLNTKLEWWVEVIGHTEDEDPYGCQYVHIWELDCGGCSAEHAIENLYELCLTYVETL